MIKIAIKQINVYIIWNEKFLLINKSMVFSAVLDSIWRMVVKAAVKGYRFVLR